LLVVEQELSVRIKLQHSYGYVTLLISLLR